MPISTANVFILIVFCYLALMFAVPAGMIAGIFGVLRIRKSDGRLLGLVFAAAGVVITILALCVAVVFHCVNMRVAANRALCCRNLGRISAAVKMYEIDHGGLLPPPDDWVNALYPYTKNRAVFACPAVEHRGYSYAMNSMLRGLRVTDIKNPQQTVLLFESIPGSHQCGGVELLPVLPRHYNRSFVLCADNKLRPWLPNHIYQSLVQGSTSSKLGTKRL